MLNKRILWIIAGTAAILPAPLIAMQFTAEVQWTAFDFIFMGALLLAVGLGFEFVSRRSGSVAYKWATAMAALGSLALIWMNGAVGIIGDSEINMLYTLIPIAGVVYAVITGFKPISMAHALFMMAGLQLLFPVVALLVVRPEFEKEPGIVGVFMLNAIFAAGFAIAGGLYRKAAEVK